MVGRNVACIPCRMKSSRLPGKPMIDLCGKPMFVWVYENCVESNVFDSVVVVCEGKEIVEECRVRGIPYYESKFKHENKTSRVHEFASHFYFDHYFTVNGDDPLLFSETIREFYCKYIELIDWKKPDKDFVMGSCVKIINPSIALDQSNIKIALSQIRLPGIGRALYLSRSMVPYPKNKYCDMYKYTGIEVSSRDMLSLFNSRKQGNIELCEDVDPIRWLEIGVELYYANCDSVGVSVDTSKDIVVAENIINLVVFKSNTLP